VGNTNRGEVTTTKTVLGMLGSAANKISEWVLDTTTKNKDEDKERNN
jgi:hypothetical protein